MMRLYLTLALLFIASWSCGGASDTPAERVDGDGTARRPPTMAAAPTATATPEPVLAPAAWAVEPSALGVAPPPVSAAAAVVLDEASGAVLYEKEGSRRLAPASLTKIATAIIALEKGDLSTTVTVDVDSRLMPRSTLMGLLPGDEFSLRDLLYGMMLPSGNDAALAVGRHIAGSDAAFVAEMNALAARLGLRDTHFANPHGLGSRNHVTSAADLALLARYAMSIEEFRTIVGASSWVAEGSRILTLYNINSFLFDYPGADGLKTGYTWRAGPTLAASAVRDGRRVYVVLLNAPQRESDARALMDWAFAAFRWPAAGVTR